MTSMLILRTAGAAPKPLTKTITAKVAADGSTEYVIGQYDSRVVYFQAKETPIDSFERLCAVLNDLIKDKYSCVIRGALREGTNREYFMRRKISNKDGGCIEDVDQRWLCIDIDSFPLTALGCSLAEAPAALRAMLPTCFARAACWWNFSPSQGYKQEATVSIHMWFYLDDELSNSELKEYWSNFNESFEEFYGVPKFIDTVLFDSIQVHYTAPPDIIGFADVLVERYGVLPGDPAVKISDDWIRDNRLDGGKSVSKYLDRVGGDKDGFHSPLLSASAAWVRAFGSTDPRNAEFKTLARDVIKRANKNDYSEDKIKRYMSDQFLDHLLKSAASKGFDKKGHNLDGNAIQFMENYVYLEMDHMFFKKSARQHVPIGGFDAMYRAVVGPGQGHNIFMEAQGQRADRVMFLPGESVDQIVPWDGQRVYNKWRGRQAAQLSIFNAKPWEEHISFLCDGRKLETKLMLDYFAFIIRTPGRKVKWAPIIGSSHGGTGKSILKIPLMKLYAGGYVEISTNDLKSTFNPHMENELVVVEEVYSIDNREIYNNIKASLTEKFISINQKGLKQYQSPNFANFILFTNHASPFPIERLDRRFFMVYSDQKPKPQEYYTDLVNWLENNVDTVYSWAMTRDLSGFNPDMAPMDTEEKLQAIESSANGINALLQEAKESCRWPLQHDVVMADELIAVLKQSSKFTPNISRLAIELRRIGCVKCEGRPRVNGGRPTVWVIRDVEKWTRASLPDISDYLQGKVIGTEREYYTNNLT